MAYLHQTPVHTVLLKQEAADQEQRWESITEVLRGIQFLVRQGLAIREHTDHDSKYRECALNLLADIKCAHVYAVIKDETQDIAGHKQLSLSLWLCHYP